MYLVSYSCKNLVDYKKVLAEYMISNLDTSQEYF